MRLFAERGYERTALADIADAAEVAIRTVTGYFHSKADLALSYADDIGTADHEPRRASRRGCP